MFQPPPVAQFVGDANAGPRQVIDLITPPESTESVAEVPRALPENGPDDDSDFEFEHPSRFGTPRTGDQLFSGADVASNSFSPPPSLLAMYNAYDDERPAVKAIGVPAAGVVPPRRARDLPQAIERLVNWAGPRRPREDDFDLNERSDDESSSSSGGNDDDDDVLVDLDKSPSPENPNLVGSKRQRRGTVRFEPPTADDDVRCHHNRDSVKAEILKTLFRRASNKTLFRMIDVEPFAGESFSGRNGVGVFGLMFTAQGEDEAWYVLKAIGPGRRSTNEIAMATDAAKLGLGLPVAARQLKSGCWVIATPLCQIESLEQAPTLKNVMEYMSAGARAARNMGRQLVALFDAQHTARIDYDHGKQLILVHNDLHPGNIIWDELNQRWYLIDFGKTVLASPAHPIRKANENRAQAIARSERQARRNGIEAAYKGIVVNDWYRPDVRAAMQTLCAAEGLLSPLQ